jgi:hypothetical protein
VRAWRYWQMSPRRRLRSVAQRHVEWLPARTMNAVCLGGGHPAPDPGCWCGFSGARDLATLKEHGLCVQPGPVVVGEVFLWGRVLDEPYGYRAQHARPAALALVEGTAGGPAEQAAVLAVLQAYEVDVTVVPLDYALAGTTAAMLSFQLMSSRASRGLG